MITAATKGFAATTEPDTRTRTGKKVVLVIVPVVPDLAARQTGTDVPSARGNGRTTITGRKRKTGKSRKRKTMNATTETTVSTGRSIITVTRRSLVDLEKCRKWVHRMEKENRGLEVLLAPRDQSKARLQAVEALHRVPHGTNPRLDNSLVNKRISSLGLDGTVYLEVAPSRINPPEVGTISPKLVPRAPVLLNLARAAVKAPAASVP